MYTVIAGFDRTQLIDFGGQSGSGGITFTQSAGDPQPKAAVDVPDAGSTLSFVIGDECIIFDENVLPIQGSTSPIIPAHNLLLPLTSSSWVADPAGTLNGLITTGSTYSMTFSNSALGLGLYQQTTLYGYVHPGQKYMFSMYLTMSSPLTNAQSVLQIDFLDATQTLINGASVQDLRSSTVGNAQQRISISGTAPARAAYIMASFGGQTTVGGTNSGTIVFATPQLEPMWFTAEGVSYPTPDNNTSQVYSAQMPDGTFSTACRVFAGTIDDFQISYDGPNRVWHISLAGPGAILENGQVNAAYAGQYDDQIITSVVNTFFSGQLSLSAPNNVSASPVVRGALVDSISYSDNTLREILNNLSDQSGYVFYVDMYYTLRYNPSYYTAASWSLTDGVADNVTSFNYYEYQREVDGTQRKRRIKVVGGKFLAPAITDVFSANGSTSVFNLSQQPFKVDSVISNGNGQLAFFKGTGPTLGSGGYKARIDKTAKTVTFSFNPAAGTNNVSVTYSYEGPVTVLVLDQNTANLPVAPSYTTPNFDAKVNDTNLLTIAAAIQRGLAELSKLGEAQTIITLKCGKFATVGTTVFFTSSLDGIVAQPLTVQQIDFKYLGNGINEYNYQLGVYRPTLLDHIRNANKAANRSTTTATVTNPNQTDLVFSEQIRYSETITFTSTPPNPSTYGTGIYGTNTYS